MKNDMPIDLGYKMDMGPSSTASMAEKMYPNLHLEWPSDYDLPDSGEMTVTFRKTGENKSKNRDGKMRYTVDLEIKSINSVEEGEADAHDETAEEESGSDALDRHAAEVSDKEAY
jgi:hypothetical protein